MAGRRAYFFGVLLSHRKVGLCSSLLKSSPTLSQKGEGFFYGRTVIS